MQNKTDQKLISIVIPVHNEEGNVSLIYERIKKIWQKIKSQYSREVIFVDDGSRDNSAEKIEKITAVDDSVKMIRFSRNFGKETATSAGIHHARGEAVIMIDADLQHPPEKIPEFIEKWKKGADVVVGVRKENKSDGIIKKIGSVAFYKIINVISETRIVPQATDFRLLDRSVVREFNKFTERNRITRGLVDWLGFKRKYVYFDASERANGKAQYNTRKLFQLAISSTISMSLFPLKLAGYLGTLIIFISGPLGLFIFVEKYVLKDPYHFNFSGPAILAVIILFLVGIILVCLGLIALYIANIHVEIANRPIYIIKTKKNL